MRSTTEEIFRAQQFSPDTGKVLDSDRGERWHTSSKQVARQRNKLCVCVCITSYKDAINNRNRANVTQNHFLFFFCLKEIQLIGTKIFSL